MSVDSARNKVLAAQKQIANLQRDKSREAGKMSDLTKRASSAYQAALKATSPSTAASRMGEYERYQRSIADVHKKVSEYEDRISREQQRLADAQKELSREEDRVIKNRLREDEQRARATQRRMQEMSSKLVEHDSLHRETMSAIERLSQLPEKITVLFLASNPVDQHQLRLDAEARAITEMIRKSKHRDSVRFESCWAVQPLDVLQAINEHSPRIVHFSGHGSDRDEIVFQDKQGNAKTVSKEAIVQTMLAGSADIQLVFFNTCFSHLQAEAVTAHVKAAVGMKVDIGDEAARVFAAQFYSAIGFGHSVKRAFEQAKAALMLEGIPEENTPVLKAADEIDVGDLILVRPPHEEIGDTVMAAGRGGIA
jgi:predicted  nucleic acid-binding Zn-ribbon protein